MVFQDFALFPHLSAWNNARFGLPRGQGDGRVAWLFSLLGLEGLEQRYPHQLSGGSGSVSPWHGLWHLPHGLFSWMSPFPAWMLKSVCISAANCRRCWRLERQRGDRHP